MPKRKAGKMAKSYDPIAPVAEEISEEACVLCFDEFQVCIFSETGAAVETALTESDDVFLLSLYISKRFVNASLLHSHLIYDSCFRSPTSPTP